MKKLHFYAVIIGTEILNGRRTDKHFSFLKNALLERGYTLFASFVIKDDLDLIEQTYRLILADPLSVMFSFGGIGSTPDDLTRAIAAKVFTDKTLVRHQQFERDIIKRFGDAAYPHRIFMSDLPENALLLKNPVNNMSGFYLQERFFFVPGFPEMAHTMVHEALENFYPPNLKLYRFTLYAQTSENTLIDLMEVLPEHIELSSLPVFRNNLPNVELSIAGYDESEAAEWFSTFTIFLDNHAIAYVVQS
ncbi:MAG: competence/damage-inducible protein A [Epsilonproteobacteria bacterium]|nr:MAG: competence/damage-inducible protein A [Campylobacterota bacterium]